MYIAIDAGSSFLKLAKIEVQGENISVLESERRAVKRVPDTQPYKYEYDIAGIVGQVRDYIDRAASAGKYEFVYADTGKYEARVRGRTAWDNCKPRSEWEWGDIYKDKASLSKRLRLTNNGLEAVLINDDTGVII